MTEEMKEKIFQEYFRPSEFIGHDTYHGDLRITNVGFNSETCGVLECIEQASLVMEVPDSEFYYRGIQIMDGEFSYEKDIQIIDGRLESEDENEDHSAPIKRLLSGKSKEWELIAFEILSGDTNRGHSVNLVALRDNMSDYIDAKDQGCEREWYKKNSCILRYRDRNKTTLLHTKESNIIYLVKEIGEDDGSSMVEITEFIDYRKTRTFSRWFYAWGGKHNRRSWDITFHAIK